MPKHIPHRVHSIPIQQPDDPDDGDMPVDPDEGLIPPMIPDDPEYDRMVETDNFVVLDGTLPVNKLQKQMREIVAAKIELKRFAPRAPEAE